MGVSYVSLTNNSLVQSGGDAVSIDGASTPSVTGT